MTNLIKVINRKNRTYNCIKPNQIVEIAETNLVTYLDAGFQVFGNQPTAEAEKTDADLTKAEIVAKLSELGFEAPNNLNKAKLLEKLTELTAEAEKTDAE